MSLDRSLLAGCREKVLDHEHEHMSLDSSLLTVSWQVVRIMMNMSTMSLDTSILADRRGEKWTVELVPLDTSLLSGCREKSLNYEQDYTSLDTSLLTGCREKTMNYEHEYVFLDTCLLTGFREKIFNCEHKHNDQKPRFRGLHFLFDRSRARFSTDGHVIQTTFFFVNVMRVKKYKGKWFTTS
jgi:hypothetical protein